MNLSCTRFWVIFLLQPHFGWGRKIPEEEGRDVQEIITERLCQEGQLTLDGRVNAVNTQSILKLIVNDNYIPLPLITKSCWINLALSGISVAFLCHTDASFL